jgi:hypothetical protein
VRLREVVQVDTPVPWSPKQGRRVWPAVGSSLVFRKTVAEAEHRRGVGLGP